mmetsp:Transcript_28032/g.74036  ORF Transcript_28032/g.74036 Transcript_28032/m.74036 type:complete len:191 (-) Transcript_28032:136-708(-)
MFLLFACLVNTVVSLRIAGSVVTLDVVVSPGTPPSLVQVQLRPDWAPLGVHRFREIVQMGNLDGAAFFRVVPGFIVQFGLPASPMDDDLSTITDDPVAVSNKRGTLVFATSGPNTRTSQLFINLGDNAMLDAQGFAPIGTVEVGMDVVDRINPEYAEKPDQFLVATQGDTYLNATFPNLARIQKAGLTGI